MYRLASTRSTAMTLAAVLATTAGATAQVEEVARVAAAFDVPALVVLDRRQYRRPIIFPDRIKDNHWNHESFLYPQHAFLLR